MGDTRATPPCGRRCPPIKSSATSTCRSRHRRTTSTAGTGRATTCSPKSLVCLDANTGQARLALPAGAPRRLGLRHRRAAPILLDVTVNGRRIKAVAQVTKQAFTYVFDRVTGQPVWPIEERPVPPSDVPGERLAPTQPYPTKPPAFDRQGVTPRRPDRFHAGTQGRSGAPRRRIPRSARCSRRKSSPARMASAGC